MSDPKRATLAPNLDAAVRRSGGYTDLADQALSAAAGVMARVNQLKPGAGGIEMIVAEAIYSAAARERAELPRREALAAKAAIAGARAVIAMKLTELEEKAGRA